MEIYCWLGFGQIKRIEGRLRVDLLELNTHSFRRVNLRNDEKLPDDLEQKKLNYVIHEFQSLF